MKKIIFVIALVLMASCASKTNNNLVENNSIDSVEITDSVEVVDSINCDSICFE